MKNEYGTLCEYKTSNVIRAATREEWLASRCAEASNIGGGTGVIEVDGQSVYVEGGCELSDVRSCQKTTANPSKRRNAGCPTTEA